VNRQRNQAKKTFLSSRSDTEQLNRSYLSFLDVGAKESDLLKRPCASVVRSASEHIGQLVEVCGKKGPTVILEVEMVHYRESYG
jgi:hypothetical protein